MTETIVQYRLKPDSVLENENLINGVFKELHEMEIAGFHYACFKLKDGVSFIHIACAESEESHSSFIHLPAFRSFQSRIKERCIEPPLVSSSTLIGAYNFINSQNQQLNHYDSKK